MWGFFRFVFFLANYMVLVDSLNSCVYNLMFKKILKNDLGEVRRVEIFYVILLAWDCHFKPCPFLIVLQKNRGGRRSGGRDSP